MQPSATLDQARRTPIFWLATLSLSIHSLLGTAVTFHIVSIFAEAGRSQTEAFAYFLPAAVFSTVTNLLCGWLSDKRSLKPFMIIMLGSFLAGAAGLLYLQHNWGYAALVVGFGIGGGLWSVTSNLAFIRNFGPLHLGEITGLCTSIMVFASAIGPALFSLGLDYFGSYAAALWVCIVALVLLLGFAIVLPQESPGDTGRTSPLNPEEKYLSLFLRRSVSIWQAFNFNRNNYGIQKTGWFRTKGFRVVLWLLGNVQQTG